MKNYKQYVVIFIVTVLLLIGMQSCAQAQIKDYTIRGLQSCPGLQAGDTLQIQNSNAKPIYCKTNAANVLTYMQNNLAAVATTGSWNDILSKPSLFSGSYLDLTNRPTIPTNNNQLTNGANYITAAGAPVQSVAGKTGTVVLAAADIASGTFADGRIAQSNVTQYQSVLSIAASQVTGTKTAAFISDFQTTARASISVTGNGSYNSTTGVITINTPSARSFSTPTRTLGSCFQISATNDSDFHYGVDSGAVLALGTLTAAVTSYTNSGCSTGAVIENDGAISGLAIGQGATLQLNGTIAAGRWVKITGATTGLGNAASLRTAQREVVLP